MPRDKDGTRHPSKGKPSGANKSEGTGLQPTPPSDMKEYKQITDEYIKAPDQIADNVHVRHSNRHISEDPDQYKQRMPNPKRDRTEKEREDKNKTSPQIRELSMPLRRETFKQLATYQADSCVSIYLDTHQSGMEVNEGADSVQFKNALKEAEKILGDRKTDITTIERMLSPAYELLQNTLFWKQMKKGFACFISPDTFDILKMNSAPGKKVIVEKSFYILPVLNTVMSDEHFFLLDLSKKQNRFFKGNRFGMDIMEIENMPDSFMEEVSDRGVSIVFRYNGQGSMHGYGDGNEEDQAYLVQYLKKIDNAIMQQLGDSQAPLILCGVQFVTDLYRKGSSYHNLVEATIPGNHQHETENELFKKALEIADNYLKDNKHKALDEYGNLSATDKTSDNIEEVISASYYGKVKYLFIRKDAEYWGRFDEMKNEVKHLNQRDKEAEDLIDTAAANTIINGGEVFVLDESMPNDRQVAATFRY